MTICRLCLTYVQSAITINVDLQSALACVVPEINVKIPKNTVICIQCCQILRLADTFKRKCLATEDTIKSFLEINKSPDFNLLEVVVWHQESNKIKIPFGTNSLKRELIEKTNTPIILNSTNVLDINQQLECQPLLIQDTNPKIMLIEKQQDPVFNVKKNDQIEKLSPPKKDVKIKKITPNSKKLIIRPKPKANVIKYRQIRPLPQGLQFQNEGQIVTIRELIQGVNNDKLRTYKRVAKKGETFVNCFNNKLQFTIKPEENQGKVKIKANKIPRIKVRPVETLKETCSEKDISNNMTISSTDLQLSSLNVFPSNSDTIQQNNPDQSINTKNSDSLFSKGSIESENGELITIKHEPLFWENDTNEQQNYVTSQDDEVATNECNFQTIINSLPEIGEEFDQPEYIHINNVSYEDMTRLAEQNKTLNTITAPQKKQKTKRIVKRKKSRPKIVIKREIIQPEVCKVGENFSTDGHYLNDHDYLISPFARYGGSRRNLRTCFLCSKDFDSMDFAEHVQTHKAVCEFCHVPFLNVFSCNLHVKSHFPPIRNLKTSNKDHERHTNCDGNKNLGETPHKKMMKQATINQDKLKTCSKDHEQSTDCDEGNKKDIKKENVVKGHKNTSDNTICSVDFCNASSLNVHLETLFPASKTCNSNTYDESEKQRPSCNKGNSSDLAIKEEQLHEDTSLLTLAEKQEMKVRRSKRLATPKTMLSSSSEDVSPKITRRMTRRRKISAQPSDDELNKKSKETCKTETQEDPFEFDIERESPKKEVVFRKDPDSRNHRLIIKECVTSQKTFAETLAELKVIYGACLFSRDVIYQWYVEFQRNATISLL